MSCNCQACGKLRVYDWRSVCSVECADKFNFECLKCKRRVKLVAHKFYLNDWYIREFCYGCGFRISRRSLPFSPPVFRREERSLKRSTRPRSKDREILSPSVEKRSRREERSISTSDPAYGAGYTAGVTEGMGMSEGLVAELRKKDLEREERMEKEKARSAELEKRAKSAESAHDDLTKKLIQTTWEVETMKATHDDLVGELTQARDDLTKELIQATQEVETTKSAHDSLIEELNEMETIANQQYHVINRQVGVIMGLQAQLLQLLPVILQSQPQS